MMAASSPRPKRKSPPRKKKKRGAKSTATTPAAVEPVAAGDDQSTPDLHAEFEHTLAAGCQQIRRAPQQEGALEILQLCRDFILQKTELQLRLELARLQHDAQDNSAGDDGAAMLPPGFDPYLILGVQRPKAQEGDDK